jgi:hypothetical protein
MAHVKTDGAKKGSIVKTRASSIEKTLLSKELLLPKERHSLANLLSNGMHAYTRSTRGQEGRVATHRR